MGRPPSADLDKFIVRLPQGMKDKIAAAAKANNRTMTAEIVFRLDFTLSIDLQPDGDGVSTAGFPVTIEQRLESLENLVRGMDARLKESALIKT